MVEIYIHGVCIVKSIAASLLSGSLFTWTLICTLLAHCQWGSQPDSHLPYWQLCSISSCQAAKKTFHFSQCVPISDTTTGWLVIADKQTYRHFWFYSKIWSSIPLIINQFVAIAIFSDFGEAEPGIAIIITYWHAKSCRRCSLVSGPSWILKIGPLFRELLALLWSKVGWVLKSRQLLRELLALLSSKAGQSVKPHGKNPRTLIAANWFTFQKRKHL